MIKILLHLIAVSMLISCSQDADDERESAVRQAKILLNTKDCREATAVLEDAGFDPYNAEYLQTLAAAYACFSDFDEINFFQNDIANITFSSANFLGSLATFSTSNMTSASDTTYTRLLQAISTIAYGGAVNTPVHAQRALIFTNGEMANMNAQLLYMQIAQLGKFANYYGDGAGTATKGTGGNHDCFHTPAADYARAAINLGVTGSCTLATDSGHPDLTVGGSVTQAMVASRMCEGVVLFNQFFDTLLNTVVSAAGGSIDGLDTDLQAVIDPLCGAAQLGDICTVTVQSTCEANYTNVPAGTNLNQEFYLLENYFAAIFELLYTNP